MPDDRSCSGPGHCQSITNCGGCGGGGERCEVCACNGVTYASAQQACVAGVMSIFPSAGCGKTLHSRPDLVACASDAHCPADMRCCARTRVCYLATDPWRCDGAQNCDDDQECLDRATGQGGGGGSVDFCKRDSCGQVPGVCAVSSVIAQSCAGDVETVCGCDGMTYVNACWANAARTNVASTGACP